LPLHLKNMEKETYAEYMLSIPYEELIDGLKHLYHTPRSLNWVGMWYSHTINTTKFRRAEIKEYFENMAKKPTDVEKKASEKPATWGGYKNIKLTDDEYQAFDSWFRTFTPADTQQMLSEFGVMGKFTLAYKDGAWSSTLTSTDKQNRLWTISSFSDNVVEAMALLFFKVDKYPNWLDLDTDTGKTRRG
jgi:hypothetical protein